MALRNLTNWSDPRFRMKSRPVVNFDEGLWTLLEDMRDTLMKARGYGCAAVHVGVLRRVVVILDDNGAGLSSRKEPAAGLIELVNPVISKESEETQEVMEGSIAPGAPRGTVVRPKNVTALGFDRHGNPLTITAGGFLAATLCHEIDHLDGVVFTDKVIK